MQLYATEFTMSVDLNDSSVSIFVRGGPMHYEVYIANIFIRDIYAKKNRTPSSLVTRKLFLLHNTGSLTDYISFIYWVYFKNFFLY